MIPASKSFTISFIEGFNLHCGYTLGLTSSSMSILCIQNDGEMPLMLAMVYPITDLCSLNTRINHFSSNLLNLELMITGKASDSPRYTLKHESDSDENFMALKTLNAAVSSWTLKSNFPSCTSIKALPVARNGRPKMRGISLSSSISNMIKSARKMTLSTLTSISSTMPLECLMDLSASYKDMVVGFTSPIPNLLKTEKGIRLMFARRSHKTLSNVISPITQGIVKLPGSLSFGGSFFGRIALHSSVSIIGSSSSNFLLFDRISLRNYA